MPSRQRYRQLCRAEDSIPIFAMDWWLDAVCGRENWNAAVVESGGRVVAALPYFFKRKYGLRALTMPPLTQTLGPWIHYPPQQKHVTRLGYEKDLFGDLIGALPEFDYFVQNFHHSVSNWTPFYWKGFQQTTLYTYLLDDLSDTEKIWAGFQEKIRGSVRKAQKELVVTGNHTTDTFVEIQEMTYRRQGRPAPVRRDLVLRLDAACAERGARRMFFAEDSSGRIHAVLYLVWDSRSAYYLMAGADPALRSSGAPTLLLWEAIRFAATVTKRFDFEGSMIESIESFFRGFGGRQVPYLRVIGMSPRMRKLHLARELAESVLGRA